MWVGGSGLMRKRPVGEPDASGRLATLTEEIGASGGIPKAMEQ